MHLGSHYDIEDECIHILCMLVIELGNIWMQLYCLHAPSVEAHACVNGKDGVAE